MSLDFTLSAETCCRRRQPLWSTSAAGDFPKLFFLIIEAQKPIPRIVALAAVGARNKAAQMRAMTVKVFRNGKGCAATARNKEHVRMFLDVLSLRRLGLAWHGD